MNLLPILRRTGFWAILSTALLGSGTVNAQNTAKAPALELKVGTNYMVVIPKKALGKEHLLSASIIPQQTSPTSTGLAGKIVRFEIFHDGVDLYESTKGLVVTEDLPARRLLTTFPIVSQTDTEVVIDFNRGMRRVFTDIWYGSGNRDRVMEVPQSRVFAAEVRDNILALRQSVQARDLENGASVESRYEVRYFLSTYEEPAGRGREQSGVETRYARFFETAPVLETTTGRSSTRMARFDLSKPITFHYSANTPEPYVEAIRNGILYWNRAFGTNVIRAEKAPEGVTAPDPRYNIVQWVPWDGAGSAYADILVDPRTGDSRHGQAYMTSVFAVSGRARARAALRSMRDLLEAKTDSKDGKGDVIECDFVGGRGGRCPKVYHQECLPHAVPDGARWLCPRHHSRHCAARAVAVCRYCPTALCAGHLQKLRARGGRSQRDGGEDESGSAGRGRGSGHGTRQIVSEAAIV
jgi:hypothetical protein